MCSPGRIVDEATISATIQKVEGTNDRDCFPVKTTYISISISGRRIEETTYQKELKSMVGRGIDESAVPLVCDAIHHPLKNSDAPTPVTREL